jgi:uncharacterized protein YggE
VRLAQLEDNMSQSRIWIAALIAAASVGLAAVACTPETNVTVSPSESTGIAVSGTGTVTVVPDIALLNLGVEVTRDTVAEARSDAADAMQAIRDSLEDNGVEERDIQTQFFNIFPQYDFRRDDDTPRIIGFTVNNQVQVKVREIDDVSRVLDEAIDAGGDNVRVNNVSFTVDEPEQFLDEAREEAVADARTRAEQLAELSGVELGAVRTISEAFGGGPPVPLARLEAAADFGGGAPTPIGPGEAEITLTVNVVFEIE